MGYYAIKEAAVLSVGASLVANVALTLTMTITSWLSEGFYVTAVIVASLIGLQQLGSEVLRNIWSDLQLW